MKIVTKDLLVSFILSDSSVGSVYISGLTIHAGQEETTCLGFVKLKALKSLNPSKNPPHTSSLSNTLILSDTFRLILKQLI